MERAPLGLDGKPRVLKNEEKELVSILHGATFLISDVPLELDARKLFRPNEQHSGDDRNRSRRILKREGSLVTCFLQYNDDPREPAESNKELRLEVDTINPMKGDEEGWLSLEGLPVFLEGDDGTLILGHFAGGDSGDIAFKNVSETTQYTIKIGE